MSASIFRYEVPIDGRWHNVALAGRILHVANRDNRPVVEFWAIRGGEVVEVREFRAFATGEPLPDDPGTYVGTALAENGFVWHLIERTS